jgi:hypothetical protein
MIRWLINAHDDVLGEPEELEIELSITHSIDKNKFTPAIFKQFLFECKRRSKSKMPGRYKSDNNKDDLLQSSSTMKKFRSAIAKYYVWKGTPLSLIWCAQVKMFLEGVGKKHASYKEQGLTAFTEGADELKFNEYKDICMKLLIVEDSANFESHLLAHIYLIYSWNLMSRVNNVSKLRSSHFSTGSSCGDAFAVRFARTKSDQKGERTSDPKHVYANPLTPEICPYLTLGMHFAIHRDTREGGSSKDKALDKLFPGGHQSKRFGEALRKHNIDINAESDSHSDSDSSNAFRPNRKRKKRKTAHSARKGAPTYASTVSTDGPTYPAVCHRAGIKNDFYSNTLYKHYIK